MTHIVPQEATTKTRSNKQAYCERVNILVWFGIRLGIHLSEGGVYFGLWAVGRHAEVKT